MKIMLLKGLFLIFAAIGLVSCDNIYVVNDDGVPIKVKPSSGVGNVIPQGNMIVTTKSGLIQGAKIESDISEFYAFLRIPYAQAPIGDLRFKNPKPIEPWNGVHNGTYEGPVCPQLGLPQDYEPSEDCLTMNIYTRQWPDKNSRIPVFVYFSPGAFRIGYSKLNFYGPHYLMKHDVIVIKIQFRMNIHGFLNLNNINAPGNQALADSILGLEWIRENIEYFGGDPNHITIGGLSSGGIQTHALMISPKAQGLFHKAVIQSGTTLGYRFVTEDVDSIVRDTKLKANMTECTNEELYTYLMSLTSAELLELQTQVELIYPPGYAEYYPFSVTVDYTGIIPKKPMALIMENNYKAIPILIGFTAEEGIRLQSLIPYINYVNEHFEMVVPYDLYPIYEKSEAKASSAHTIKQFYFGEQELSEKTFHQFTQLCTDSWYGHVSDYLIRLMSALKYDAPIFSYIFAVDGAYNFNKLKAGVTYPGAMHADDIGYIWHVNSLYDVVPTDNYSDLTRERYVTMLVNFIKTSDPIPEQNSLLPIKWPTFNYPEANYLLFNNTFSVVQNPMRERLQFWQKLYGLEEL